MRTGKQPVRPKYFSGSRTGKVLTISPAEPGEADPFEHMDKNSPSVARGNVQLFNSPRTEQPQADKQVSAGTGETQSSLTPTEYSFPVQRGSIFKKKAPLQGSREEEKQFPVSKTPKQADLNSLITQIQQPRTPKPSKKILSESEIKERSDLIYKEHLFQTFQALKFVKQLPPIDSTQLRSRRMTLPKREGYEDKKTLIMDLDETLVHCTSELHKADVVLPVSFPSGQVINAGINIRPYALECLREANKYFEVVVFTASHRCYADCVLDYLDPERTLIHHRLYRENCLMINGVYIKDLRIFSNRRLQEMVIVDNAAYSFGYQLDNGVPIISWQDDVYDKELFNLMDYLKVLAEAQDVRDVNRQTFHLRTFYADYIKEYGGGVLKRTINQRKQPVYKCY